jgi:hypothetical protein
MPATAFATGVDGERGHRHTQRRQQAKQQAAKHLSSSSAAAMPDAARRLEGRVSQVRGHITHESSGWNVDGAALAIRVAAGACRVRAA